MQISGDLGINARWQWQGFPCCIQIVASYSRLGFSVQTPLVCAQNFALSQETCALVEPLFLHPQGAEAAAPVDSMPQATDGLGGRVGLASGRGRRNQQRGGAAKRAKNIWTVIDQLMLED